MKIRKLVKIISRIWEFISRLARVVVYFDDFLIDAEAFWKWLTGKDTEPEKKNVNE